MTLRQTAAAVALGLLLPLAACGGSDDTGSGGWTFTDDVGTEIVRDAVPERIVAHTEVAVALADMGLGDRVVGTFGAPPNPDPGLGLESDTLDLESVEDVTGGGDYGDVDLEKLAELDPDLVVTTTYSGESYWYLNDEVLEKIQGSYDLAGIEVQDVTLDQVLKSSERLATALGADEADFEQGREALAAAGERLETVAAEAGDPQIVVVAPSADVLYVANTPAYIDLRYLRDEIGLDLVVPDEDDVDPQGYWHNVSWENADAYADADIAMWDTRGGEANLTLLKDQPVWEGTTAARADAYVPWRVEVSPSAQGYASLFERFADDLERVAG